MSPSVFQNVGPARGLGRPAERGAHRIHENQVRLCQQRMRVFVAHSDRLSLIGRIRFGPKPPNSCHAAAMPGAPPKNITSGRPRPAADACE